MLELGHREVGSVVAGGLVVAGAEAFEGLRLAAQRLEDKLSEVEELQQRLDQLLKGHEV